MLYVLWGCAPKNNIILSFSLFLVLFVRLKSKVCCFFSPESCHPFSSEQSYPVIYSIIQAWCDPYISDGFLMEGVISQRGRCSLLRRSDTSFFSLTLQTIFFKCFSVEFLWIMHFVSCMRAALTFIKQTKKTDGSPLIRRQMDWSLHFLLNAHFSDFHVMIGESPTHEEAYWVHERLTGS